MNIIIIVIVETLHTQLSRSNIVNLGELRMGGLGGRTSIVLLITCCTLAQAFSSVPDSVIPLLWLHKFLVITFHEIL